MPKEPIPPFEHLIDQLHGKDWTGSCDAARLLGQSRDPRAVDALLPDLSDSDWRVRRNAAQALGALRDKRAVGPLLQALKDRTMTVRQRAIVALGRIKDPRALPALLEIVVENKHESFDASIAVRKFGKKALAEIVQAYEKKGSQELMMLLIELKYEGAFGLVLRLLESQEPGERLTAIRELGKLGDERAIPYLVDQLEKHDPLMQGEAVRALGKLNATETAPAMLGLLTDHDLFGPCSDVYHAVTEAFQAFGGIMDESKNALPGKYPAMFNMGGAPISLPEAMGLLGTQQPNLLLDALTRFQDRPDLPDGAEDPIADLVRKTLDDMLWKYGVMFADARDAGQNRVTRLMDLLATENALTRSAAALTLPWYGDERSLESLKQLTKDMDERVRTAASWAVGSLQKVISYRR
jgi:HEAT repeat protein